MTSYNAIVQLVDRFSDELAEQLIDELIDYHPAASRSPYGRPEVILTVEAESLRQATSTVLAVVQAAGHAAYSLEVLPTEAFDQRLELEPMPELLSVAEAAEQLGVSRQAVQKRIDSGSLPARRVGKVYAVPRSSLSGLGQRIREQAAEAGVELSPPGLDGLGQRIRTQAEAAGLDLSSAGDVARLVASLRHSVETQSAARTTEHHPKG